MTSRRVTLAHFKRIYEVLRELGLSDRGFEIRVDGVTAFPLARPTGETAFDVAKRMDALRGNKSR